MIHKQKINPSNPRIQLKKYATIGDNLDSIKDLSITKSSKERKMSIMEGWLEKYFEEEKAFYKVYCILHKRNLLLFSSQPENKDNIENLIEKISMDNIVSLQRTKEGVFELYEESDKIILKLRSKDPQITNKWLFSIQRNIAISIPKYQTKFNKSRRATVANVRLIDQKKKISSQVTSFYSMDKGRRSKMEDMAVIIDSVNSEFNKKSKKTDSSIYAIYDGHAGIECATFLQKFLHSNLCTHPSFKNDLKKAMEESFEKTDGEFRKWAVFNNDISGSTAIMALVRDDELYVANCGDSRAVLFEEDEDNKTYKVIPLSNDHKPFREDEKNRITNAGGWISSKKVLNIPRMIRLGIEEFDEDDQNQENWVEVFRVNDVLAMTRSMGEILIKDLISENFEGNFTAPIIIAKPEITVTKITKNSRFMIMASDGLWDVFTNEEVRDFVMSKLNTSHFTTNHNEIVTQLLSEAIERGSLDNVTVILIWFDPNQKK